MSPPVALQPTPISFEQFIDDQFYFQGELARRWGMALGRTELARVALLTYIAERRADALRDLGKLVEQAEPIWAQRPSDPALGPNIRAAWERAAEA